MVLEHIKVHEFFENFLKNRKSDSNVQYPLWKSVDLFKDEKMPLDKYEKLDGITKCGKKNNFSTFQGTDFEPHHWKIPSNVSQFELVYSIISDAYTSKSILTNSTLDTKKTWLRGISSLSGSVFRKEEQDWKMVYLCRRPGSTSSTLTWTFSIQDESKCVDTFDYEVSSACFHGASVLWELHSGDKTVTLEEQKGCFRGFQGVQELSLRVTMTGGQGDNAWQHAQLFRRSFNSVDSPFVVRVTAVDRQFFKKNAEIFYMYRFIVYVYCVVG